MDYKFATENVNYEDYSSGRVLYSQGGTTSFPVRLASEIFQRCVNILEKSGKIGPYSIYDPCCGGAYMLTTLGFLHSRHISGIYASDIDENVVTLASRNLSLLTTSGLDERIKQIKRMISDFGKPSHKAAFESALRLKNILSTKEHEIPAEAFCADATKLDGEAVRLNGLDIVMTDLPYGEVVNWGNGMNEDEAVAKLLDNLFPRMLGNSVVAIISKKKTSIKSDKYKRVDRFMIGKRQAVFLKPLLNTDA